MISLTKVHFRLEKHTSFWDIMGNNYHSYRLTLLEVFCLFSFMTILLVKEAKRPTKKKKVKKGKDAAAEC